jgi:hypothetical protein
MGDLEGDTEETMSSESLTEKTKSERELSTGFQTSGLRFMKALSTQGAHGAFQIHFSWIATRQQ